MKTAGQSSSAAKAVILAFLLYTVVYNNTINKLSFVLLFNICEYCVMMIIVILYILIYLCTYYS